jgi:hypothetical protein
MLPSWRNCNLKLAKVKEIEGHQKKKEAKCDSKQLSLMSSYQNKASFMEKLAF